MNINALQNINVDFFDFLDDVLQHNCTSHGKKKPSVETPGVGFVYRKSYIFSYWPCATLLNNRANSGFLMALLNRCFLMFNLVHSASTSLIVNLAGKLSISSRKSAGSPDSFSV